MCMVKENLFNKEKELKQTNVNGDWTQLFRKVSFTMNIQFSCFVLCFWNQNYAKV